MRRFLALVIFTVLIVAAPLLFGAVDRIVQIGLAGLLTVGLFLSPPELPPLSGRARWMLFGFLLLILGKEFLPATFFGMPDWRRSMTADAGVMLPWTHNPEPARVLDILLEVLVGAAWFVWVRTLAARSENRVALGWCLFAAAVALAMVCFVMGGAEGQAIYGIRDTPGWKGFGPFPNRNHTGCFLAMGALVGSGCIVHVLRRRRLVVALVGTAMLVIVVLALFASRSRGALLGAGVGVAVFAALGLARNPSRKGLAAVIAGVALAAAMLLALGAQVRSRFAGGDEGDITTNLRWDIWGNAVRLWEKAPIFGHGLGTFPQVFPLHQNLPLSNMIVLHPESSWLQWLTELGALPLAILAIALGLFVVRHQRQDWSARSGFFIRTGALSGLVVLLCHSLWDVPAHRWGTAAFGLALLALACPLPAKEENRLPGPGLLMLPALVAAFWSLPIFFTNFVWSPLALAQTLANPAPSTWRLRAMLQVFPLNARLHQQLGLRDLAFGRQESAWRHFQIASRLLPSSFSIPLEQARVAQRSSGGMALYFWTEVIERAGHRSDEYFRSAVQETAALPGAEAFWSGYADAHPRFLLTLAQIAEGPETGRAYFLQWWDARAFSPDLDPTEIDSVYRLLARWGTPDQLRAWMQHHPERVKADAGAWANLLHHWGEDALAWQMLSRSLVEPPYGKFITTTPIASLENRWRAEPDNYRSGQELAAALADKGSLTQAEDVIIATARYPTAPTWLRQKAAFALARRQQWTEAVTLALAEDPAPAKAP